MKFETGMVLIGYCNGYFGRDYSGCKVIEAFGCDWIVVRRDGKPDFTYFSSKEEMQDMVKKWTEDGSLKSKDS